MGESQPSSVERKKPRPRARGAMHDSGAHTTHRRHRFCAGSRGAHLVMTAARELREEGYNEGFAILALGHALFAEERLEPALGVPGTEGSVRVRGHTRVTRHTST